MPISTPGWDNAPYLSAGHYITKDPDTGIQNVGNYRGQLKAPRRLGMNPSVELRAGIYAHWLKYKARGEPLPCAVVVGCPPAISYASVQKMPENLDEVAVAGAIAGGPINVVRAKTVDLLVPAEAEIVIEGCINTEFLEPEAPFGESHGYVNLQEYNAFMDVTAITRRRNPDPHLVHQPGDAERVERHPPRRDGAGLPPSSASRRSASAASSASSMHEPLTSLYAVIAIQFARGTPETEIWRALARRVGAAPLRRQMDHRHRRGHRSRQRRRAVLGDVLPLPAAARSPDSAAQGSRPRPARSARQRRERGSADQRDAQGHLRAGRAAQARVHGERDARSGSASACPRSSPQPPWHGYDLGHWPKQLEQQARLATESDYFSFGANLANERRSDVAMNTPVERDEAKEK